MTKLDKICIVAFVMVLWVYTTSMVILLNHDVNNAQDSANRAWAEIAGIEACVYNPAYGGRIMFKQCLDDYYQKDR